MKKIVVMACILLLAGIVTAQHYSLPDFLQAEGIEDTSVLSHFKSLYADVLEKIKEEISGNYTVYKQHKKIYKYLHENLFKKYSHIPFLTIIFDANLYNALTATIVYTLITDDLVYSYQLYANQLHVFIIIFDPEGNEFCVDLTNPDYGFDCKNDRDAIINIMQFHTLITAEDILDKSKDQLYTIYWQSSFPITRDDLLILYYTQIALSHHGNNAYEAAYRSIATAFRMQPNLPGIRTYLSSLWRDYRNMLLRDGSYSALDSLLIGYAQVIREDIILKQEYLEFITSYVSMLSTEKDAEKQAIALLISLAPYIDEMAIRELHQLIYARDVETLLEQGNYRTAYKMIMPLYLTFSQIQQIKDLFITAGQNFMTELVNAGRYKEATGNLDSLLVVLANDPVIKNLYVNILLKEMSVNNVHYITNPVSAESLLVVAFAMDSSNISIKQTLIYLYHLRAMEFTRNDNLEQAKIEVEKGLRIDPENRDLLEDLRLLEAHLKP